MPEWAANYQYFDMSEVPLHGGAFRDKQHSLRMTERVQELAKIVADRLQDVPDFDLNWAEQSSAGLGTKTMKSAP